MSNDFGPAPLVRLAVAATLLCGESQAQNITVDGRLSPAQTLAGPNYAIGAEQGRRVGGNLFHSFGAFGLNRGETATFSGPAGVGNVVGRVTGGAASSINGGIRSTIPGANLYLINPAGVVFGPNASVDVGGSFHASTADYLRMSDGARFQATNPDASTLSAAPPEAFGFLSADPRPVTVDGSGLRAAPGRTLGVVGGAVTISAGLLSAPAGTVHVASAAGPGEVPVDPRAGPAPTVARAGRVRVEGRSTITVSNSVESGSGGSVFIRAGELSVAASKIDADNFGPGPGGVLSLRGDGAVTISDGANLRAFAEAAGRGADVSISTAAGGSVTLDAASIRAGSSATGDGGAVAIGTGTLTLRNGALVLNLAENRGNGGPISVTADSVLLDGPGTRFTSQTSGTGLAGAGGNITLTSGTLTVQNNAAIRVLTFGAGAGGSISVNAGSVLLDGPGTRFISETSGTGLAGAGGNITLTGGTLTVQNNAAIQALTFGGGAGGSINAALTGNATVAAGAQIQSASIAPAGGRAGDAGRVAVAAQDILIQGGQITSSAPGAAGKSAVTVNAAGDLVLDAARPGSRAAISSAAAGDRSGGPVLVTARNVSLLGNSFIEATAPPSGVGGAVTVTAQGNLTLDDMGSGQRPAIATRVGSGITGSEKAGTVRVSAADITLLNANIAGPNADVDVAARGALSLDQGSFIAADNPGSGSTPSVRIAARDLTLAGGSDIGSIARSTGRGGDILINVPGTVSVTGTGSQVSSLITSLGQGSGDAGNVTVNAGALTLSRGGAIASVAVASGKAGEVALNVAGALTIDGAGVEGLVDSVSSEAPAGSSGPAGTIRVTAGSISVLNGAFISSFSQGTGAGGSVVVTTPGTLLLDSGDKPGGGIVTQAIGAQSGDAGTVTVSAGTVAVQNGAVISSSTDGAGRGGTVTINAGALTMSRTGQIASLTYGIGSAGEIALNIGGALTIDGAGTSNTAVGSEALPGSSGPAGTVRVNAGSVSLLNGGVITSSTRGAGAGGSVLVATPGTLLLDGGGVGSTRIVAQALGPQTGNAGTVTVSAGSVAVQNGATISSATNGSGQGGNVSVSAGALTLARGGSITTDTFGSGNAGAIALGVGGALVIDGAGRGEFRNGVSSEAAVDVSGSAGGVRVSAGSVSVLNGGFINSNTRGTGAGGSVRVATPGALLLDGGGGGSTEIAASALGPRSGAAGTVTVSAGSVAVQNGARIASATDGPGRGGTITLDAADTLTLSRGGSITSDTSASGNAGGIALNVGGVLTINGAGAGSFRNGVSSEAAVDVSGSAGGVRVSAGSVSVLNGGFINSNTRGTGAGGSVRVATPGALLLDGGGGGSTEIAASALGPRSGAAGTVTVSAGSVAVQNGARIASATDGPGRGGNVGVTAASDIRLSGPGPQITATATGAGAAGSITVSAPRLSLRDGAAISTDALAADGGNIAIGAGDLLYLQRSSITTSVGSGFGNGGNITVDPRFVVLDRSFIQANAVGGNGGNVLVRAEQLVQSAESAVTSTSQRGVSGTIFINAQPLNLNGALVVLASDLRSAAALLREGCAARGAVPRSSLIEAGHGGQRQAFETLVPALYFAHRPLGNGEPQAPASPVSPAPARVDLLSRCE